MAIRKLNTISYGTTFRWPNFMHNGKVDTYIGGWTDVSTENFVTHYYFGSGIHLALANDNPSLINVDVDDAASESNAYWFS